MLKWLFGANERAAGEPEPPPRSRRRISRQSLDDVSRIVHIPELNFIGHQVRSANGRFILLWRDGNDAGTVGGARQSGLGRYYLVDGDLVVAEGRVERPNDGRVANNGTFTLNDWRFTSELCGMFLAFRADGSPIIARTFAANIFDSGLSDDGRYAVCQACNAPNSEDSSRLVIFDLETGIETGSCVPESGWAARYEFPADRPVVRLLYLKGEGFDYCLDGAFLDRDAWVEASLAKGDVYLVQKLFRATGGAPSPELAKRLLISLDGFLINAGDLEPHTRALALKLKGACCEILEEFPKALRSYDAALALDPKIGVKRRAEQLRKLTGS